MSQAHPRSKNTASLNPFKPPSPLSSTTYSRSEPVTNAPSLRVALPRRVAAGTGSRVSIQNAREHVVAGRRTCTLCGNRQITPPLPTSPSRAHPTQKKPRASNIYSLYSSRTSKSCRHVVAPQRLGARCCSPNMRRKERNTPAGGRR